VPPVVRRSAASQTLLLPAPPSAFHGDAWGAQAYPQSVRRHEPKQLRFCYSAYGKPALVSTSSTVRLCFNVSHSHELALYAVTYDRAIGIDIEHPRTNFA